MQENQEIKKIVAFCDCCDCEQSGTKAVLENVGWFIGEREQFCPTCNE